MFAPRISFTLPLLAAACATPGVLHVGAMRDVMRDGRTEARAALAAHTRPGTYGVGALTGLRGEILIDDGTPWVAVDEPLARPAAPDATATLLTTASVPAWMTIAIDADLDGAGLATLLAARLPAAVASRTAVPFLVDGRGTVALHVVRGACPYGAPIAGGKPPARWTADTTELRLVGFFAPDQEGVLTHHGTALHVHAFASDAAGRRVMGHVDHFVVRAGATLRVPVGR